MAKQTVGEPAVTENTLLGGRIRLRQPQRGYRVAIDPVLLAAAVPARYEDRVLDVGAGAGAGALCLAARVPGVRVIGLEQDPDLVALGQENAALNNLGSRITFLRGDIGAAYAMTTKRFDHVMANPPYLESDKVNPSSIEDKRIAHVEPPQLATWVDFCLSHARPRGTVTLIHRADRIDAIVALLHAKAGDIRICPLWPRAGVPARRVILRCRKGVKSPAHVLPGLVLHGATEKFTPEAEAVLRRGAPLFADD